MGMKRVLTVQMPIGCLGLVGEENRLTNLYFDHENLPPGLVDSNSEFLVEADRQLTEYFAGKRTVFNLALAPAGTAFQKRSGKFYAGFPMGRQLVTKRWLKPLGTKRLCGPSAKPTIKTPSPSLSLATG